MRNFLIKLGIFLALATPALAHAQFNQNQVNVAPYGGFLVATSTSGGSKISATSTPYFANFYANIANINRLGNITGNGLIKTSSGNGTLGTAVNGTDYTLITAKTCTGSDFFSGVTAAGVFTCATPAGFASTTLLGDTNTWSGNNTFSNTITGAITGNAGSATVLQNARTINGVSFNGSANIVVASTTLLADLNTFTNKQTFGNSSTTLASFAYASSTSYFGANLAACTGANALTWTGGFFGCQAQPQGTVTSVTATNPLFSSGGATPNITTIFGTTSTWGLGNNGLVMTGATGIPFVQATSSAIAMSISGNAATVTTNANLTGVVTSSGNTTSYGSQAAGVLGNSITGNTAPMATSTLYGAIQPGKVLGYSGGLLIPLATTTMSCSTGVTCSFAAGNEAFSIAAGAITLPMHATQAANTFVANGTGGTASPTAISTTTIFGTLGAPGTVPMSSNGIIVWAATSSSSGGSTFGKSWEIDTLGQLAPTTTLAVSIPTWLSINDQTLAYASTTNHATIFGLFAGGNSATTSPTDTQITAFGHGAAAINATTGLRNTALGYLALTTNQAGDDNTAVGNLALTASNNGSANRITAIGSGSLKSLTGNNPDNTGVGYNTLTSLILSGANNVAVGSGALSTTQTGVHNVAVGKDASVSNNSATTTTVVGAFAAQGLSTYNNKQTAVFGYAAGQLFITGSDNNTLFGYQSGSNISSGYANLLFGPSVTANNLTTGNGNIGIGNEIFFPAANSNNTLNIGNLIFGSLPATSTALLLPRSGSIGIGSTSPFAKFAIHTNNGDNSTVLFAIGSSTQTATSTIFGITNVGHLIGSSTSPILSSCGTSPTIAGDDAHGYVTVGSVSATGCTITFASSYGTRPVCNVTNENMSVANAMTYTVSATAITISQTALTGNIIDYSCRGF